jgi:hypothetical protein
MRTSCADRLNAVAARHGHRPVLDALRNLKGVLGLENFRADVS